jgi:hypothetical protein
MWPWEHLAVGYVVCSCYFRLRGCRPDAAAALAVAFGTQFPDLVDKPLAWVFGLLPGGVSLAHSVLVAPVVAGVVVLAARRRARGPAGEAFALGYLSHLPADLLYPLLVGGSPVPRAFLWPLVVVPDDPSGSLLATVLAFADRSLAVVTAPGGARYVVFEALLLVAALALWTADGTPGGAVLGIGRDADSEPSPATESEE